MIGPVQPTDFGANFKTLKPLTGRRIDFIYHHTLASRFHQADWCLNSINLRVLRRPESSGRTKIRMAARHDFRALGPRL